MIIEMPKRRASWPTGGPKRHSGAGKLLLGGPKDPKRRELAPQGDPKGVLGAMAGNFRLPFSCSRNPLSRDIYGYTEKMSLS